MALCRTLGYVAITEQLAAADDAASNVPGTLGRLMAYYGLRDTGLAELARMARSTVRTRRTGEQQCTASDLAKFAAIFGVPVLVFYLAPDEALRWVIDHPERRPVWLADHLGKSRKS